MERVQNINEASIFCPSDRQIVRINADGHIHTTGNNSWCMSHNSLPTFEKFVKFAKFNPGQI